MAKAHIFMKPEALDELNDIGYDWDYSSPYSTSEVKVFVDDVQFVNDNGQTSDKDFVGYYGLNWDHVIRVERGLKEHINVF